MGQLYHICRWDPQEGEMSGHGFCIILYPAWKGAVKKSDLTEANIEALIKNTGPHWLANHGYKKNIGHYISIRWGEWGPEHITVPGDATGLDIGDAMGYDHDGKQLSPHNVDTWCF